jgi:hypothetical protein
MNAIPIPQQQDTDDPGATGAVAGRDTAVDMILSVLSPEELAALRQH